MEAIAFEAVTFLKRVTADTRRPVKFVDSAELAYVMTRYRECHDLMHVLIGSLPISTLGELVVKVFEARQTRLPMCALASIGGQYHLKQRCGSSSVPFYSSAVRYCLLILCCFGIRDHCMFTCSLVLFSSELIDFYRVWLPWVLRQAARAPLLMNVYFEKHLREDMGELSARLNIEPPPYVIPRARYDPQKRAKENK